VLSLVSGNERRSKFLSPEHSSHAHACLPLFPSPQIIVHALINKEQELNNAAHAVHVAGAAKDSHTDVWTGGNKEGARRAVMLTALPFAGAAVFALWIGNRSQVGVYVLGFLCRTCALRCELKQAFSCAKSQERLASFCQVSTLKISTSASLPLTFTNFQKCNERSLHLAMPYFVASVLFASLPRLASISAVWAFVALCIVVACVQVRPC